MSKVYNYTDDCPKCGAKYNDVLGIGCCGECYAVPIQVEQPEGEWIYEYDWLRELTLTVNALPNGADLSMEEVENVLIALNYPFNKKTNL